MIAVGHEASTLAARPARFQHAGQPTDGRRIRRLGGEHQLHLPSHSSTGLSLQQSPLLHANTSAGSKPQPAGLTERGAPQQSHEGVGEASLLHQSVAATAYTSSGSSACESFLSLCRSFLHEWTVRCENLCSHCCLPRHIYALPDHVL